MISTCSFEDLIIKEIKAGDVSIDILTAFRAGTIKLFLDSVSLISSDISEKNIKAEIFVIDSGTSLILHSSSAIKNLYVLVLFMN